MTLDAATVARVEGLLGEGKLSYRQIAKVVGICRGSVLSIALGRRAKLRAKEGVLEFGCGPVERCVSCGRRVQMPCLACWMEARAEAERRLRRKLKGAD